MVDLARELDDEDEAPAEAPKKKRSALKLTLIITGVMLIVALGVLGALYFTGTKPFGHAAGDGANSAKGSGQDKDKQAIYYAIDPPFVVNFADQNQMRFLQVTMEVMAYDQSAIDAVKHHMPVIRNNLVMLLSSQDAKTLFTLQGKEDLRAKALQAIQQVLEKRTGSKGVEEVYFTSFVMQ